MERGGPSLLPIGIVWATLLLTAFAGGLVSPAASQTPGPAPAPHPGQTKSAAAVHRSAKCQHPADPLRRHAECIDQDFEWDETLAGAWNPMRKSLREVGITPTMSYTGALQTNASGGPHQVWSYAGQLGLGFFVDLRKVIRVPGMSAYVSASWGTGSDLTGFLNSSIPLNGLYAPGFFLGEMYIEQNFSEGKVKIVGGRLAPSNSFAVLPVFANYVNYGINPNPYSLGANDIIFFGPPTGTEWGAQATYNLSSEIQLAAGAFNTNKNSANGEGHGTDFALQEGNKGALVIGEIDYLRNQRSTDTGKPGQYAIGVLHNNNSFPTLPHSEAQINSYSGLYVMGQQMVYRPSTPGSTKGLTAWGTYTFNSKPLVNPMPAFLGAGASYEGLIPARPKDIVSAGWIYGKVSKEIPNTSAEQLLEVNYQWRHSRYLIITPHFQYIWKPNGRNLPDAMVAGLQLGLTF
jgi:carbohydrate-selective porin OprB